MHHGKQIDIVPFERTSIVQTRYVVCHLWWPEGLGGRDPSVENLPYS